MGSKNKLKRFRENATFSNVLQPGREAVQNGFYLKGNWQSHFGNDHPIVLELGCGKGDYTLGLARLEQNKNFVGVDIKGARIWRGAKTALEENLPNVAFLRTQIELIDQIFGKNEVSEIWITFPDPQIKYKRTKHRMTNPSFLKKYRNILSPHGLVHLKTDSEFMYGYTLGILQGSGKEILYANNNVYTNEGAPKAVLEIQTFYEKQYLEMEKPITYIQFRID